jgi:hypothetical protein
MNKKSLAIGIGEYEHFSPLDNSINDATDFHSVLAENGFESTLIVNPSLSDLIACMASFKDSISENTISVIFFAGHGLQDDKHNYLVAADSEVKSTMDIKYNCLHADDLFIKGSETNLHLVVLDACRNNPFKDGTRGLTVGLSRMSAAGGTLIAFATSPNTASLERPGDRNGIYTKHLLRNMKTANLPVELVFKHTRNHVMNDTKGRQIPWEESSLHGDNFSFVSTRRESIETLVAETIETDRKISLVELIPFLNKSNFSELPVEQLLLLLAQVRISSQLEDDGDAPRTVDPDYFNDLLFVTYFPLFDERLFKEDNATEPFTIDIFEHISIENGINFGYNFLDEPDESFSRFIMNVVQFKGEKAILLFYLSVKDDQHMLKPAIVTSKNGTLSLHGFALMTGEKVNEIIEPFIKMREPFEKEIPDITSSITTETISEEKFQKMFGDKI